jgi:hypothetical protein
MKRSFLLAVANWFAAVGISTVAFADTRTATACAASLTTEQRLIYQSVLPDLTRETNLSNIVRTKVVFLVSAGRLQMSSAPDAAKVAGRCLQMVHQ